uniref:CYTH domain-containing protein n=2 Tax=Esox lucius TaxID=8010 RepID=A0A3P8Y2S3_ESOLU
MLFQNLYILFSINGAFTDVQVTHLTIVAQIIAIISIPYISFIKSILYADMPFNVEIKAKVSNASQLADRVSQLSQSEGTVIHQQDTFFNCSVGRLKLRNLMDGNGQLIFYERPDCGGPKLSKYSISNTQDPEGLRAVLADALGVKGEVKKERRLFLVGQTRIHLDTVEGLGHLMELEVVMKEGQSLEEGEVIARSLMKELGVREDSLVTGAYIDLLLEARG